MSKKIAYFLVYLFIFLFVPFTAGAEATSLELLPPINQQTNYDLNVEGFKKLLFDLYQFGTETSYTIQIDGTLDLSQTTVGADEVPSDITLETITFGSVPAKLTFEGTGPDAELYLPSHCYFGQDIRLRELTLQAEKIYGNGHQLSFEEIQHVQTTQLFGGSDRDLIGNPKLMFQQVTGGTWEIYGGNESGTLTGNPMIQILDMTGDINRLSGGSLAGKIIGSPTTEIRSLNGTLSNYYGGGIGAEGNIAEVTGEVNNQLTSSSASFTLGNFVGGVAHGKTGPINTTINGTGGFSPTGILIGGSQTGEIFGKNQAITTAIDTRQFKAGERSFVGGNQYSGVIHGGIENLIYAGKADHGSFKRIDGGAGMDVQKASLTNSPDLVPEVHLTDPQKRTAEELHYDQLTPVERLALAKDQTSFLVEGNVTTRLLGGCVSGGMGVENNVSGAGYAGVIEGKIHLVLGEETLVYSKRWGQIAQERGIDPNSLTNEDNLGSNYGFSAAAGGGGSQNFWENALYIKGETEMSINQGLLSYAYGGSFSGMLEGNCRLRLSGGQSSGVCGAGGGFYRIYGDSMLEVTGGKVERYAIAGSNQDRRMFGSARTEISGGTFLGLLAASYGVRSNHMIDGNVETIVSGGTFTKSNDATQIMGGLAKNGMISGNVSLKVTGEPKLAAGIGISAARPRNASLLNRLGGTDKQIGFELTTKEIFSELEVLGDGGENPTSLYTPKLDLEINAPQGSFALIQGMIKNGYTGKLTHDLTLDIQAAQGIKKLVGSDLTSFTNRLIANSTAKIDLTIGGAQKEISFETIDNFTQLTIGNKVSAKSILNGNRAAEDNFAQEYHRFGDLSLEEGASLTVEKLKTGSLTAAKKTELHSPAGAENIFLRDLLSEEKLNWHLLRLKEQEIVEGNYFAKQKGYSVLTLVGAESTLSPENFIGYDETGHVYTGDMNASIGLAVAATIIDYQVESSLGEITHDLSLRPNNHPLPLKVWGIADRKKGKLIIPAENKITPILRFIETDQFSFKGAQLTVSNGEKNVLKENTWQPTDHYHYQIQADFQKAEGSLKLLSVPEQFDFGQQPIGKRSSFFPRVSGELIVEDQRPESAPWQLTLQAESSEIGELYFQEDGKIVSLEEAVPLFMQKGSLQTNFDDWDETKGIFLSVPKEKQKRGEHTLTFHWTLSTKVE